MIARARGRRVAWCAMGALLVLFGCGEEPLVALGTLEYERITTPSPAAERIVAIEVHKGQDVVAGQTLVRLDMRRSLANTRAARAEAEQQGEALTELRAGPRQEDVQRARAELSAKEAEAKEARSYSDRLSRLLEQGAVAPVDVDDARAAADRAEAEARAARAVLLELEHGTRPEQIAQGEAAELAASAEAAAQAVALDELRVVAPRDGRVDDLPYYVGDRPPVGAPLAILLVGEAPYARVYVPEPIRAHVRVGQAARVFIDGREEPFAGRVRMVRSEPSFTPYYALTGDDAARLSYLAEIALTGADAEGLPAGLPVRVELAREVGG